MIIALSGILFSACNKNGSNNLKSSDLKNENDSISYALAYDVASRLKAMEIDTLNLDAVNTAFNQVYGSGDTSPLLNKNTVNMVLESYFMKKQMEQSAKLRESGDAYLNSNKSKPGVNVLPSGLQYKVINPGGSEKLGNRQKVLVHYTGKLTDGKIFDSTQGGEAVEINVNEVIPGWTEALKLMPVGAQWEIVLPADLAYGSGRGPGNTLPPFAVLIFNIELVKALD